jgi:hypothetical protein
LRNCTQVLADSKLGVLGSRYEEVWKAVYRRKLRSRNQPQYAKEPQLQTPLGRGMPNLEQLRIVELHSFAELRNCDQLHNRRSSLVETQAHAGRVRDIQQAN